METNLMQVAEIQVIYSAKIAPSQRPQIRSSQEAYTLFLQNWDQNRIGLIEQFKVAFLNRSNRVLGLFKASSGGMIGTVVDVRLVMAVALKAAATSIILCHNHPSYIVKPSQADIQLTKQLREAGKFLEIPVLDHLIICPEYYYSFADEGII